MLIEIEIRPDTYEALQAAAERGGVTAEALVEALIAEALVGALITESLQVPEVDRQR